MNPVNIILRCSQAWQTKSAIMLVAISFHGSDKRIKLHNLPNHLPLYLLVASVDPSPLASPSSCGSPVAHRRWAPLEARLQRVSPPGQSSIQCFMGGLAFGKGSKYPIKTSWFMVIYIMLYRSSIMMFFRADFKAWWFQSIDWCGWPPAMICSWLSWCFWFPPSCRMFHRLGKGWKPKALRFIFLWLMCNQDWTTALGSSCFPFASVLSLPTCYDIPTRIKPTQLTSW